MRADRLVAMLMLLQKNGRTKARTLAKELEVSERTVYRDVDALSTAGVPVYTQTGPGGGISLLDSYRTDLTGLTTAELQALLALTVPAPLRRLGLGADLTSALRKVAAATPDSQRESSSKIQERIYIDSSEWSDPYTAGSSFETIRKALWDDFELHVTYYSELGSHAGTISAVVRPLGLVAAAGDWYLVAARDLHTIAIAVASILAVDATADQFVRQPDFQLESFWQSRAALRQQQRPSLTVEMMISESALPLVGEVMTGPPEPTDDGRFRISLRFENFERARLSILGLGNAAEVFSPLALRLSVADYARQIAAVYEVD